MMKNICLVVSALTMLVGCGGGGDAGVDDLANAYAFDSYDQAESQFTSLQNLAEGSPATEASDLPTTGTARYDGILAVLLDNNNAEGVIGTMRIEASFADDSFSGQAGDFFNLIEEPTAGSITISDGSITNEGLLLSTNVDGQVTFESGTRSIDAEFVGAFSGSGGEVIAGVMSGFADDDPLTGALIGERQ